MTDYASMFGTSVYYIKLYQLESIVTLSTGCFIMFSMITNIYNKKTKGPTLMALFTATGKLIFFCVCGKNLNIVSMCAVSLVVHTSNVSSCQINFFGFPAAVNNYIKVGPLVFLL